MASVAFPFLVAGENLHVLITLTVARSNALEPLDVATLEETTSPAASTVTFTTVVPCSSLTSAARGYENTHFFWVECWCGIRCLRWD